MALSVVGAGGGGGGGFPADLSIGAVYNSSADIPNDPNLSQQVSLDTTGVAAEIYLHGLAVNGSADAFVVGTKGRYAITVSAFVYQDDTNWNAVTLWADATPFSHLMADPTRVLVPPASSLDLGGPSIVWFSYGELDVGAEIQFYVQQGITRTGTALRARDIYCQAQYVGLATSI